MKLRYMTRTYNIGFRKYHWKGGIQYTQVDACTIADAIGKLQKQFPGIQLFIETINIQVKKQAVGQC